MPKKSPSASVPPPKLQMRRREVRRTDGRYLIYYEFSPPAQEKKCQS